MKLYLLLSDRNKGEEFDKTHKLDDTEIFYVESSMFKTRTKKAIFDRVGFIEVVPSSSSKHQKTWPIRSLSLELQVSLLIFWFKY